jgi:hypothetical protein
MKNKQKAWRLGAIVMGRRARANKQAATIIGGIFREFPQRLPMVHRKRELLEVKHGGREFCSATGALLAPWTGYTAALNGMPGAAHRGQSGMWTGKSLYSTRAARGATRGLE